MRSLATIVLALIAANFNAPAQAASETAEAKQAFFASIALLNPRIGCRFKYATEARSNTAADLAEQAGQSMQEMLKSYDRMGRTYVLEFTTNPDKFCNGIAGVLRKSANIDVSNKMAPTAVMTPHWVPQSLDEKKRRLFFVASVGLYAVNERCGLGHDNETLLDDLGKLAKRLGYSHRTTLYEFLDATNFYLKDYELHPKRRCDLAPLLVEMTREEIGF